MWAKGAPQVSTLLTHQTSFHSDLLHSFCCIVLILVLYYCYSVHGLGFLAKYTYFEKEMYVYHCPKCNIRIHFSEMDG